MRHDKKGSPRQKRLPPFTPPTLFDISTFNHVAQRPTAQPCAAPRVDASRLPVRHHERISRGGQQKAVGRHGQHGRLGRLANCRPNRRRSSLPKAIGRHGSQDDGTRFQNRINPRTPAESAKIGVLFVAFPTSATRIGPFAASRDACRRCWSSQ